MHPDAVAARLLAAGPGAAWHLVLEFGVDLRRRGRAFATIDRRLNTLRALVQARRFLEDMGMRRGSRRN